MHNFFPPPYPPPPSAAFPYPPLPHPSDSHPHGNNMHHLQQEQQQQPPHPRMLPPYPQPPPSSLQPNAGPQILALLNKNAANKQVVPATAAATGRRLWGDYVVHDVDAAREGSEREAEQLEVTPITKYGSDPEPVFGRQIAVNMHYVCYGLKGGNIRVLNLNTASRSLLRGHTKRVTDMIFYAENVDLLASVSLEGRVYLWKICEGPDDKDQLQITGNVLVAIQFFGEGEGDYVNPRICWHCNRQDVLLVGIGKCVLRVDTTKVAMATVFSAEAPLQCFVDRLIDGVQIVGRHDGEITDLSMCQWTTTHLVSASADGMVKIWEDGKAAPLTVLKPHGGQPVNLAQFLTAPHQAGHIILVTAGPLNREVKLWALASEEGWLLPNHEQSWKCGQTLELKSSAEPCVQEAFFNQIVVLSQAGLLLIANAKKNAIYSVHLDHGANPCGTRMDYLAEFTVTMPILSITATTDLPVGCTVKLYCVQTMAIQQYDLDLHRCLPPSRENVGLEGSDSIVLSDAGNADGLVASDATGNRCSGFLFPNLAPRPSFSETADAGRYSRRSNSLEAVTSQENMTSNMESKPISLARTTSDTNGVCVASPPLPLSPRLSSKLCGFRNPTNNSEVGPSLTDHVVTQPIIDSSVDRQAGTAHARLSNMSSLDNDEKKIMPSDMSRVLNPSITFKHPTHLITPSEILMSASSSETTNIIEGKNEEELNIQEVVVNNALGNAELEVKVVGETRPTCDEFGCQEGSQNLGSENMEKYFCYEATVARECSGISVENYVVEEAREVDGAGVTEPLVRPRNDVAEVQDSTKDLDTPVSQPGDPSTKGKKQKQKNFQMSVQSSLPSSVFNLANSCHEPGGSSSFPSAQTAFSQVITVQQMLNQLMTMQKELQKQMSNLVTLPVTKEGRRLEAVLGRSIEKAVKASADALWARFHEENAKNEKLLRDRTQQISSMIAHLINKDFTVILEKVVKKELAAVGPTIARTISPSIEKTITSAIAESFQRGVGDKAVNQLDRSVNSRLEATVGRQIQAQFQTSGKHALQDALRSTLEALVIPAFEKSCKAMFEQVDATFQKGMFEHATATLQHFESTHSTLALALRDSINSASSMAQTLSGEFADGQHKLLSLAAATTNSRAFNHPLPQPSNGPLLGLHEKVELTLDPTKEVSRLISDRKYEEAFTAALQRSDVSLVSWLCSQVDLHWLLSLVPLPLSQGVLLSLLQQLAFDINKDTPRKLSWLTDVAAAVNPVDPLIAVHARPIFEQVYQRLHHQRSSPTITGAELSSIRLLMHIINSMLMTSK